MNTQLLKKSTLGLLFAAGLMTQVQAGDVWVSDEIEAPLRDRPELNADIVAMLPAGQRVQMLKKHDDYVKIKTSKGKVGWLSYYYVLQNTSVHEQLAPMKRSLETAKATVQKLEEQLKTEKAKVDKLQNSQSELEKTITTATSQAKDSAGNAQKLSADNKLLQEKLAEQSNKMEELAKALDKARQKASTATTRYLTLVKVNENAVEIERQNKMLQKKSVDNEQELQKLKNENQTLRARLDTRQAMMTALLIFGGILVGYVLSVLMPPRGRRPASSSFSSF